MKHIFYVYSLLFCSGCPCGLAPHLANAVYEKVKQLDPTLYHEDLDDDPGLGDSSETSSQDPELAANSDNRDQPAAESEKLPPSMYSVTHIPEYLTLLIYVI